MVSTCDIDGVPLFVEQNRVGTPGSRVYNNQYACEDDEDCGEKQFHSHIEPLSEGVMKVIGNNIASPSGTVFVESVK